MSSEYFIGLMSGTSADGVDAALVEFSPAPRTLCAAHLAFSPELQRAIRAVDRDSPLHVLARLDSLLGKLFAQAAQLVLEQNGIAPEQVRAIGSHGQTVWHEPDGETPFTLQLGDPNTIAELTGITTVADFRRRDIVAGGQGAPLAPAFHAQVFGSADEDRCVLNLGGIANITVLPAAHPERAFGFDTGPASTLLDSWILRHKGERYDLDGAWSATGEVIPDLLANLLADGYFQRRPPKSTGREYFSLDWLEPWIAGKQYRTEDVQATLLELTAASVADAILRYAAGTRRVLVCGGGSRNGALLRALAKRLPNRIIERTDDHGIAAEHVEACAFAWLARQTMHGLAGNLPAVTGARASVILGGIYQGRIKA